MDILSNIAVVAALGFAAMTFYVSQKRLRRNEQIKIISDIEKDFAKIEEKLIEVSNEDKRTRRLLDLQYLNVWEWLPVL